MGIYVSQYLPSIYKWKKDGTEINIENYSLFPEESQVKLRVSVEKSLDFSLKLRAPSWATADNCLKLNRQCLDHELKPDQWVCIDRTWDDGDIITVDFPYTLSFRAVDEKNAGRKNNRIKPGGRGSPLTTLEQKMLAHGYRMRMVPISRLKDLKRDIQENFSHRHVDENLQQWLESFYQFDQPSFGGSFSSIAIIASKSPQVRTIFHWKGKEQILTIPPTYLDFISEPKRIKECLEYETKDSVCHFEIADNLPNKLLAVRSGLGRYGRNNLCYVPGMGSYILLTAFYSDMSVNEDRWESVQQMPACGHCCACVKICPGTALRESRFAIHAERCLTYHNEFWGKPTFPEWISPDMHNCLVGCMRCQEVCPVNKDCLATFEGTHEFSEDETGAILERQPYEELPAGLVMKLERINLHVHYGYLSRNLKVLLDNLR